MNDMPTTALAAALELAGMVIERHGSIPILTNACLTVTNAGRLLVETSDLDTHVAIDVEGGLGDPFETTVDFETLRRIAARGEEVAVWPGDGLSLNVSAPGDIRYSLPTLPASDFPRMKEWKPAASFRLSAAQLLGDLEAVAAGISTEETRYYLNGVFMHIHAVIGSRAAKLAFATTDGHRLYRVCRRLPKGLTELPGDGNGVIVPRKAIRALMAALARACDDEVQVDVAELKARFTLAGVTITTKTIDGTFPDYRSAIPTAPAGRLSLAADELARGVYAASAITNEKARSVRLNLKESVLTAETAEGGKMSMPLPGEKSGELPGLIGFQASYLVDALAPFGSALVTLGMGGPADPLLITSEAEPQLTVVLMPTRMS